MNNYAYLILIWNIIVMFVYGFDKSRAIRGGRRVREATLILCAFVLGGLGAMFGMILFNHKTSKVKFRILVPLATVAGVAVIYWLKKYCAFLV